MSSFRGFAAAAAAALTFSFALPSFAYCLTRTCDPNAGDCDKVNGCYMAGLPLYWPNSCVSFDVQKDGSKKLGISADTLDAIAQKAFAQWMNADCGNGTHPSIKVYDSGQIDCGKPEYNKDQPNANVITFHDDTWEYTNTADTLALTTVFFDGDNGEIYDANIEINSNQYDFADGIVASGAADLNAVLTHEAGHFLGLSHSSLLSATMFGSYNSDMSTLEQDDEQGICNSLAPTRSVASDSCTPRHGFSGECGTPNKGCCSTAIGSTGSSDQPLALLAFGLGVCAWRGRKRLKRAAR